jgi:hypothetical protein
MHQVLPHQSVLVRLGGSDIHGIGVFAGKPIAAGTNVFAGDDREICWVPSSVLEDPAIGDFERSFYLDFAIRRGDQLGCPANFNLLTVGWYVNEPRDGEEPNLRSTSDFNLVALRNIQAGEELTLRYSSFQQFD